MGNIRIDAFNGRRDLVLLDFQREWDELESMSGYPFPKKKKINLFSTMKRWFLSLK